MNPKKKNGIKYKVIIEGTLGVWTFNTRQEAVEFKNKILESKTYISKKYKIIVSKI